MHYLHVFMHYFPLFILYSPLLYFSVFYFNLYCIIYAKEKEYRRKEISKRADFEFELRRNGASGPDRGNDAKSQSLAKGLSEWILL